MFAVSEGKVTWISPNRKWRLQSNGRRTIWIEGEYVGYSAIVYDDGRVAYDSPHAIPKYVKQKVEAIAKYIIREDSK